MVRFSLEGYCQHLYYCRTAKASALLHHSHQPAAPPPLVSSTDATQMVGSEGGNADHFAVKLVVVTPVTLHGQTETVQYNV